MIWLNRLIFILLFVIPLAWSTKVNANYYTAKTFLLYITGGLGFLYFLLHSKIKLATHYVTGIALYFIILQLTYVTVFNFQYSVYYLAKFISLIGIVLYFNSIDFEFSQFLKQRERWFLLFFVILLSLSLENFYHVFKGNVFSKESYNTGWFIAPFGNVNMLAEFYLCCVPILFLWLQQKNKIPSIIKILIFLVVNLIIILTKSRSAYLGLGLWWMYLISIFLLQKVAGRMNIKKLQVFGLVFVSVITVLVFKSSFFNSGNKLYSNLERTNYYLSARDLIIQNPLGIGFHYPNKINPYRLAYPSGPEEGSYPDQPHSEILKWGVQFGWLGLVSVFITMGMITWFVFSTQNFFLKGFILVLTPQILFQFPFENPATIPVLALFFHEFYKLFKYKTVQVLYPLKIISFLFCLALVAYSYLFISSIYSESNNPSDTFKTSYACNVNPIYLRACVLKNYNLLRDQNYSELVVSLKEAMKSNYYAADYLKILYRLVSRQENDSHLNQTEKSCQLMNLYVFLYKDQVQFSSDEIQSCKTVINPFNFALAINNTKQFDQDYPNCIFDLLSNLKLNNLK